MAAQEWWDAVRREVRDMLVPGQANRMARTPSEDSPLDVARRQELTSEILPPSIIISAPTGPITESTLALAPTTTAITSSTSPAVASTTAAPQQTSTPDASESESGGMGAAAKAGIVIGALGAILALFVVVWLVFNMRKKKLARQRQQMEDDEKINGPFADSHAISAVPAPAPRPTPNRAPRLSLRPVTQFLPNFGTQPHAERRSSRGIPLTLNPVSNQQSSRATSGSAWERPALRATTASPGGDYHRPGTSSSLHPNPFHDNHRLPDEPVSPISSMGSFDHRVGMASTPDSIPEPVSPIIGGDDDHDDDHDHGRRQNQNQLGVASSLTRKTSIRKDLPKPLDLTKPPSPLYAVPPSPAGTEFSMHSMAPGQSPGPSASAEAIALAGGPSQSAVHRVQLDFKPTLQDELELRAGQLVRVLHEYDDGWALCIRLDRSQQGVVPRTCLSTRPVKPRPQHGGGGGGGSSPLQGGSGGGGGNPRGGPPISPSFHFGSGNSPGGLDVRDRGRSGSGSGRASPGGGGGFPAVPSKDERYGGNGGYGRPRSPGGGGQGQGQGRGGRGPPSPAPGQAY